MSATARILYVDDEKENLITFKYIFRSYYQVFTASSAQEACEVMAREEPIDIIITDQRMPKMTGVELLGKLSDEYPETIRMILTGYSDISAVIDAINKGQVYYYFQKPWIESDIRIVVDHALEAIAMRHEIVRQEKIFRGIVENMGDWAWEVDCSGHYTYVSEHVEDAFGYQPDELIGKTLLDLMLPEEAKRVETLLSDRMEKQKPLNNFENWNLSKEGKKICLQMVGVPVMDDDGIWTGYRGIARDVTARKTAEEMLVKFSMVIQQAAEIVVITDEKGAIGYVNPAFEEVSGYSKEEAVGQNPRILKSGFHDDLFYQEMWKCLSSGHVWKGHLKNKRKDGALYIEDAIISPLMDEKGIIINYVAVQRDVTNELRLEEENRNAQKMEAIGRLAGGIAHDFNNIMQAALGFCEILLLEMNSETTQYQDVLEIKKATLRAGSLSRQLLTLGRREKMEYGLDDLNAIIINSHKILEQSLGDKIEFKTQLDSQLKPVKVDAGQIDQVLLNLVINARDAMPDGGRILITTSNVENDPGSVCLSVSDTGEGISDEVREHLFEPFFTTKKVGKGTGLGLSVIYGIVTQHGGRIEVESTLGEGSEFKIYLPTGDYNDMGE